MGGRDKTSHDRRASAMSAESVQRLTATAWRRRDGPSHSNALTVDIRPGHVGDQIAIWSDCSTDRGGSTPATNFPCRHLERSALGVDVAGGVRDRLHVVPRDHAVEHVVRRQHDVPVKPGTPALGRRMKGVHSSRRQLLYCRGCGWWRRRRLLRRASRGRDDQHTGSHGSGQCHLSLSPSRDSMPAIMRKNRWFLQIGAVTACRISRRWRRSPPAP
jgi:hypothetical protein